MTVTVRIPASMQQLTKRKASVSAKGATIAALLDDLEKQFSGFKEKICDTTGAIKSFINIYVNDEDIRFLEQVATPLNDGDMVLIIPAIAGG